MRLAPGRTRIAAGVAPRRFRAAGLLGATGLVVGLSGCGFVHAGQANPGKPDGFVLRGYVSTPSATPGVPGSTCTAGTGTFDIAPDTPVRVSDPTGHSLASSTLGAGVIAVESGRTRCNFPFTVAAVPGGSEQYVITVGTRAPATFPAHDLREDKPAVIIADPRPQPS